MNSRAIGISSLAAVLFWVAGAEAATVGATLVISGNTNVPTFALTNDSAAARLERFTFTIGHASRGFDYVQQLTAPTGGTATLNSPDDVNNFERSQIIDIAFTGFSAGDTISFVADVDNETANATLDYRNTFFNNGTQANAVFTAFFGGGEVLSLTLPDQTAGRTSYSFSLSGPAAGTPTPVPAPAAAPLLVAALGALAVARRRRRIG